MVGVTTTGVLTSCEQEFYQDEQYRKEIYIVSGEDNIIKQEYSFEPTPEEQISKFLVLFIGKSAGIW